MKTKKINFKNNYRCYLLYALIILSLLFSLVVYIKAPVKKATVNRYDENVEFKKGNLKFPFKQDIYIDEDNLGGVYIYLGDTSINKYNYQLSLKYDDKVLFYHDYKDYPSDTLYLGFARVNDIRGKKITLNIECMDCSNVVADTIDGNKLKISTENYVKNNSYYWYSILLIVFCLTLLPLAKEESK